MSLAVVLGAGFSKAVYEGFPTVDRLGELVRADLADPLIGATPEFRDGSFERWLSRIAEPQPDLSGAANLRNAALFQEAAYSVSQQLLKCERRAVSTPTPWWLMKFVGILHATRATVVSFNYDTLVERAASTLSDHKERLQVSTWSILNGIPAEIPTAGTYGPVEVESFRLLKLHGSLDSYWVPGDDSGATIARLPGSTYWAPDAGVTSTRTDIARLMPGRQPFIVPPASAKSGFFSNPITRQLWQTASQRLSAADRVAIIGYSLPLTDLVASAMIGETQRTGGARVQVVNPDGKAVVDRLVNGAGIDHTMVEHVFDTPDQYVELLERELALQATKGLTAETLDGRAVVIAGPGGGIVRVVLAATPSGSGEVVNLELGDPVAFDSLTSPRGALTIDELVAVLKSTRAKAVTATTKGEMSRVIDHFARRDAMGWTQIVVLVPSAARILPEV